MAHQCRNQLRSAILMTTTKPRTTTTRRRPPRLRRPPRPFLVSGIATLLLLRIPSIPLFPTRVVVVAAVAVAAAAEPIPIPNPKKKKKKKVLSFGGNGMIGSEVLRRLISTDEYDVAMVSRGTWNFDSAETIRPAVKHVECDRSGGDDDDDDGRNSLPLCPELMREIAPASTKRDEDDDEPYYAVLDFSGYRSKWIEDAIEVLRSTSRSRGARVYVYVSTDSVYEVSRTPDDDDGGGEEEEEGGGGGARRRRSKETDAIRPDDLGKREALNAADRYGDRKLGGEEALAAQARREEGGDEGGTRGAVPYASLRFADVIGPRDGTDRYVTYHVWAKFLHDVEGLPPLHVPEDVLESSSVTYVDDAASSIIAAMEGGEEVWNEAYNVACEEIFNVTDALSTLGGIIRGESDRIDPVRKLPGGKSFAMYPSVRRGPIDIAKAKAKLNFAPTPLRTALEETARWYEEMFEKDQEYRESMLEEFAKDALDEYVMGGKRYGEVVARLWEAAGLELDWDDEEDDDEEEGYDDDDDEQEEEEYDYDYDDDEEDDTDDDDDDWEAEHDEEDDDKTEIDDGDDEDESDGEERGKEL